MKVAVEALRFESRLALSLGGTAEFESESEFDERRAVLCAAVLSELNGSRAHAVISPPLACPSCAMWNCTLTMCIYCSLCGPGTSYRARSRFSIRDHRDRWDSESSTTGATQRPVAASRQTSPIALCDDRVVGQRSEPQQVAPPLTTLKHMWV